MSCTILLPVDSSECSERAARHVAHIASMVAGLTVHIVNVEPKGDDWMVGRMITPEELAGMENEWGDAAIAPVRAILDETDVNYTHRVVQGTVPETIVRLAQELGCDQIIMGTHGRTALESALLGSVASKVLHISPVPVTLVK